MYQIKCKYTIFWGNILKTIVKEEWLEFCVKRPVFFSKNAWNVLKSWFLLKNQLQPVLKQRDLILTGCSLFIKLYMIHGEQKNREKDFLAARNSLSVGVWVNIDVAVANLCWQNCVETLLWMYIVSQLCWHVVLDGLYILGAFRFISQCCHRMHAIIFSMQPKPSV